MTGGVRRVWRGLRSAGAAGMVALAVLVLSGGSAAAAETPHWTLVASPDPSADYNFLTGVSCASASLCMGVGDYFNGTFWQTLTARWSGSKWAQVSSPDPSTVDYNELEGVSCASATFCVAVGYYYDNGTPQSLVLSWNGTRWAQVSSPDPGNTDELYGVSCPSTKFCVASGYYYDVTTQRALVLRWNGTRWAQVSSPDPGNADELYGVSCRSVSFCMADGYYLNGTIQQTLALRWSGTKWAQVSSPDPGKGQDNYLSGVSCTSTSFCMASGYYHNGTAGVWQTLTARWSGIKWARVSSPDPGKGQDNYLSGVSCTTASFCVASGYYYNGTAGADQTLALRWNGTKWVQVSSPNAGTGQQNFLEGASCTSTSFCMAAGEYYNGTANETLIEKW